MLCMSSVIHAQTAPAKKIDPNKKVLAVEATCGECQFKMKGKGCSLAIKLVGNNYFVANANIDDYGDAHEKKDSVIPSEKQKCRVRWWMGNS